MCTRHLKVRVENRGELTVGSFCESKERDKDNTICEMDVTLPHSRKYPDLSVLCTYHLLPRGSTPGTPPGNPWEARGIGLVLVFLFSPRGRGVL